jgi:hypothetical protein
MSLKVKVDGVTMPGPLATLATRLAKSRGMTVREALISAVEEALARDDRARRGPEGEEAAIAAVRAIIAQAPAPRLSDDRADDEILGYTTMFPDLYRAP